MYGNDDYFRKQKERKTIDAFDKKSFRTENQNFPAAGVRLKY